MNKGIITSNGYLLGDNFDILVKKGVIEQKEYGLTQKNGMHYSRNPICTKHIWMNMKKRKKNW